MLNSNCQAVFMEKRSALFIVRVHPSFDSISSVGLMYHHSFDSWVIRQKAEIRKLYFKRTKHVKLSEKRTFLNPSFALLPYYRQIRVAVLVMGIQRNHHHTDFFYELRVSSKALLKNSKRSAYLVTLIYLFNYLFIYLFIYLFSLYFKLTKYIRI